MGYFTSADSLSVFCYCIAGLTQFFLLLAIIKLLQIRSKANQRAYTSQTSILCQSLNLFLLFTNKVLLQVTSLCVGYQIRSMVTNDPFQDYKGFPSSLYDTSSFSSYLALGLLMVTFGELICISIIHVYFCQDKGLYKATLWACDHWYADLATIGIQILTQMTFTAGDKGNSLIDFANTACWLGLTILMIWYIKWTSAYVGFAEFFFGTLVLFIYIFIILCNVMLFH